MILKVPNGQDPYDVIGQYIRNHITFIEDIIATIEIDGIRTNELFMVDWEEDGCFVWKSDWYEGEQNIALIDFFPVSDAKPEQEKGKWIPLQHEEGMPIRWWKCSCCGLVIYSDTEYDRIAFHKYCNRCGADMRGEENGRVYKN